MACPPLPSTKGHEPAKTQKPSITHQKDNPPSIIHHPSPIIYQLVQRRIIFV
jgi:hypothetical protein